LISATPLNFSEKSNEAHFPGTSRASVERKAHSIGISFQVARGRAMTPVPAVAILAVSTELDRGEALNDSTQNIAEAIVHFIESLPSTIQTDILLFVMIYALDRDSTETAGFLPTIRNELTTTGGMKRMSVTLRTIAALDHILLRSAQKVRTAKLAIEQNADKLSPESVARFSARQPLNQRHLDRALEDWTKLRTTLITPQNLVDYEDILLRPPILVR
jgi:hypothetical protein